MDESLNLSVETYVSKGLTSEEAEEYVQSLQKQKKLEERMKSLGTSSNSQTTNHNGRKN